MKTVTPADMQQVNIKPGWLIRQFARFVFGDSTGDTDAVSIDGGVLTVGDNTYCLNPVILLALKEYDALVVQKNEQYKDAWQKDGPVTALVDLKDKLYRLDSASESGAVLKWDKNKLHGTFFDILVRDFMCMAWFGLNFVDDDDDRQHQ